MVLLDFREIGNEIGLVRGNPSGPLEYLPADEENGENEDPGKQY